MKSLKFIFCAAFLFLSIGQISVDLYLPSLPFIAHAFDAPNNLAQLSVAIFMLGFCITRLFYGPLSDAIGRKNPLIMGLSMALVGSAMCMLAPNISVLIVGRFIQGFGAAAGAVLSESILRDSIEGPNLAKYMSYFNMAIITIIAVAPLSGGYLQHYFGWRSCFIFLTCYTLLGLITSIFFLSETNKHRDKEHLKPKVILNNLKELLTHSTFLRSISSVFFAYGVVCT